MFLFFASSMDRHHFCFAHVAWKQNTCFSKCCSVDIFWLCTEQGHGRDLQVCNPGMILGPLPLQGPGGSGAFSSIPGVSESLGMLDASRVLQRNFVPPPNPPDRVPGGAGSWPFRNFPPLDAGPEERPGTRCVSVIAFAADVQMGSWELQMLFPSSKHETASRPGCNSACAAQRGCAGCAGTCPSLRPSLCSSPWLLL